MEVKIQGMTITRHTLEQNIILWHSITHHIT